jgi:hypothetical protein
MGRFRRIRVGVVSFFCSIGKNDATFCQWDNRSLTVCSGVRETGLRDVRVDMLFAPYGHQCDHERGSKNIFAHTLRHVLVEDVPFLFLGLWSEYFFVRTWKRTSWRVYWYAGCPWGRHGCSWATTRVYFARWKNDSTKIPIRQVTAFSCFSHTPTHPCARNSRTTLCFKTCKSFYQTNSHVGIPNPASYRSKSDFWTLVSPFQSEAQFEKPRSCI